MLLLSLRRLHEIISISEIPIAVRHLYVEDFVVLESRMLPRIFRVHVHVGAPQIGLPYRRIGSICLSNNDKESFVDMFCVVLIACFKAKDALFAFRILSFTMLVVFPLLDMTRPRYL